MSVSVSFDVHLNCCGFLLWYAKTNKSLKEDYCTSKASEACLMFHYCTGAIQKEQYTSKHRGTPGCLVLKLGCITRVLAVKTFELIWRRIVLSLPPSFSAALWRRNVNVYQFLSDAWSYFNPEETEVTGTQG